MILPFSTQIDFSIPRSEGGIKQFGKQLFGIACVGCETESRWYADLISKQQNDLVFHFLTIFI